MSSRGNRSELAPEKRIKIFLECIDEFKQRKFINDGLHNFKFQIMVDQKTGKLKSTIEEADSELLRSFLTDFRKFISNDEPAYIDRILNTCIEWVDQKNIKLIKDLKELKCNWKYQYKKGVIHIETAGLDLTPECVLDLWINGLFFHSNPEKKDQLDRLLKQDIQSAKLQLFYSLPILTETILNVGALVSKAYHDEKAFIF